MFISHLKVRIGVQNGFRGGRMKVSIEEQAFKVLRRRRIAEAAAAHHSLAGADTTGGDGGRDEGDGGGDDDDDGQPRAGTADDGSAVP